MKSWASYSAEQSDSDQQQKEFDMESDQRREPWNKGKLVGQKPPLKPKDIWAIRIQLQNAHQVRDLAMFNLAIDSKLRGCDLVNLRVRDITSDRPIATPIHARQTAHVHRGRDQAPVGCGVGTSCGLAVDAAAPVGVPRPDRPTQCDGHESIETTQIYLDADLAMKQAVLDKTTPPEGKPGRYRPDDPLLAFLKGL